MPVVSMQPEGEFFGASIGGGIGLGVGPFAQCGLDEALGLAIGLGGVRFGAEVFEPEIAASVAEVEGSIAGAIVGHHPGNRQWLLLSILPLPRRLPRSRAQTPPHQTLHPQDQWQGRALHPNRTARMGLPPGLSHLVSTRRRTPLLAASIQLASPTRRGKNSNAQQPPRPIR